MRKWKEELEIKEDRYIELNGFDKKEISELREEFMKNKLNTYEDLIKFLSNYVTELEQELFSTKEE